MTVEALEEASGDRLRLQQYSNHFLSDATAGELAVLLAESQPSLHVSVLILRQWYTNYHLDSGVLSYDTAEALENALGDELRSKYGGMKSRQLQATLGKRRKAILVSHQVCRSWCDKHASPLGKRTAPVHALEPPVKRRVVTKTPLSSMYPIELDGPKELEEACGHRYRTEVSDLGLGHGQRDMRKRLSVWGCVANQFACRHPQRRRRMWYD